MSGTDSEVADRLTPLFVPDGAETEDVDLAVPEFDLTLLSCDPRRALYDLLFFGDALQPKNKVYIGVVQHLAKVSRGAFKPQNIEEVWHSQEGPIELSFDLAERRHTIKVNVWGQIFDFRILLQLNRLMWDTPYRFEMVPLDDMLFVTVLKPEEKSDMERLRGLSFMVLDLPRTFHPVHRFTDPHPPISESSHLQFVGTINEVMDRCVGRLDLDVRGLEIHGRHRYEGEDHQEVLDFIGRYIPETGAVDGYIEGNIIVQGDHRPYCGRWNGTLAPGNRIASGNWRGWFAEDSHEGGPPKEKHLLYVGQWTALEETLTHSSKPYIRRLRAWLEEVWEARSADEYPWLLPQLDYEDFT